MIQHSFPQIKTFLIFKIIYKNDIRYNIIKYKKICLTERLNFFRKAKEKNICKICQSILRKNLNDSIYNSR